MAGADIFADMPTARTMATRDAVLESWQDAARGLEHTRPRLHTKGVVCNTSSEWRTMPGQVAATRAIACLQHCLRIGLSIGRQLSIGGLPKAIRRGIAAPHFAAREIHIP